MRFLKCFGTNVRSGATGFFSEASRIWTDTCVVPSFYFLELSMLLQLIWQSVAYLRIDGFLHRFNLRIGN